MVKIHRITCEEFDNYSAGTDYCAKKNAIARISVAMQSQPLTHMFSFSLRIIIMI